MNKRIEELVKKHAGRHCDSEADLRAALTDLAAEYEQQIAAMQERRESVARSAAKCSEVNNNLRERIRQLETRFGGHITVGGGHVVYGTAEALVRVQAYILLDSKHPIEARDTNRYLAKQLQAAEQQITELQAMAINNGQKAVLLGERVKQLEAERVPDISSICNAYESGVGHRGRATASINPYSAGSPEHEAYSIGAAPKQKEGE